MYSTYLNHINIHTNNKNANGTLTDELHMLYQGVLQLLHIIGVYATRKNAFSFTH